MPSVFTSLTLFAMVVAALICITAVAVNSRPGIRD